MKKKQRINKTTLDNIVSESKHKYLDHISERINFLRFLTSLNISKESYLPINYEYLK